ncbi:GNAT family N-acetyltransferase [Acidaminococcus sp.]|uniref:GNAT family N-acetyltransferase n=1 Tax=Acidaminococcus sp. TaxID=1872103 RepID=UPI003D7DC73C
MSEIIIREATIEDAAAIRAIYAPYVENTVITFEYQVPSVEEFQRRISRTKERYPYFVAEENGRVVGYAYAGPFVGRAAYDWTAELSIYVAVHLKKHGLGKKLYGVLLDALKKMGILDVYACIGLPEKADEYLDCNSAEFHTHMGFTPVGLFKQCGYKFGRWYDMIWMGLNLGEHQNPQPPIISYPQLKKQ